MATYDVTVVVEYNYEVEADSAEEAEAQGWHYEEYPFAAQVESISIEELPEEVDEEEES